MSIYADAGLPAEYDTLHVGIVLYDPATGSVVDANAQLESLFGYPLDELRTMLADEYSANTYSFSGTELVERLRATADGNPQQFKWRVKRSDGELIWVRFHLSPTVLDGTEYVLAEVHDITDSYVASRRVGLFSRILRHNLRNEVNVIAGCAGKMTTDAEIEDVRRTAETIRATAMDLGGITESVKEIERATTPTEAPRATRRAADAVRDAADRFRDQYPAAAITIEERERMWIRADSAFDHAIVHSDEPEPTVDVTVDASPNTGRVEIRIADSAPPIPEIEIDALDEFTAVTSTSHGSGVGLFVMKWCIESIGGELAFETREPRGNVVHFYLPPKEPPETAT
ncbi:PAS domain-containing sensor histidine kinase [Natrinema sp. 1APR25-10V2]|uniref:PAS domain-containing sensor histidine kinase n=1 Tax=Natrinema sp. 1APR25-10V2 TaxID=2951081 RepID=UPI002875136D|nr:PAS domain-containing sensor histidine kinase [Natrinema sp. 1APR25-10V2]MDS0477589.1 PAS domain-containing sensor histidine kinase [Natrinema sp. 1APR25-10V2]